MDSQRQVIEMDSILSAAQSYCRRGWAIIPVPFRQKRPLERGWQNARLSFAELVSRLGNRPTNLGILTGAPSGWLVDVDLDHRLALSIADDFLPQTDAIFGRASKPRSHWLFYTTRPLETVQWRLPDRKMVVELRSTGSQTVFPGSVHPEGEAIRWYLEGEPAEVDPELLRSRVTALFKQVCKQLGVTRDTRPTETFCHEAAMAPASVLERARRYLAKVPPAISGQGGHDATFHAACVLAIGFGLDHDQTLALLGEWNERCQPPWTDKELEHKVDDALRQPGWRGFLLARERRPVEVSNKAIARANRHAIEHRRRARRRSLA